MQNQHKPKHQHKQKKHYVPRPDAAVEAAVPVVAQTTTWYSSITSYVSHVFWAILGYKPETLVIPAPCKECNQRAKSQPPPDRRPLMAPVSNTNRSSSLPPKPKPEPKPEQLDESQSLSYYAEKLRLKRLAKQQQIEVESLPDMPPAIDSDSELAI